MQTKKVWAGLYGGHYSIIVFFKEKPKTKEETGSTLDYGNYDCYDNKDLIIGDMPLEHFLTVFPDANIEQYLETMDIEVEEVFEMEITTCFDKDGYMQGWVFKEDW